MYSITIRILITRQFSDAEDGRATVGLLTMHAYSHVLHIRHVSVNRHSQSYFLQLRFVNLF